MAIYSESGGTYSYSYDIIDTYTAGQSFVIELNADCNYLGVYSGTSSEIYMYDGTNFTSIDTRNAIFGNPSISDYGEIAVVLQMVSNGVVI